MNTKSNNPSRAKCEEIIRRILMTEVLEHGDNQHFRCAADFMNYFESLYPASPGLTKQVQRAVKSMDMPKNEKGFFIVNKSRNQFENESSLRELFATANAKAVSMDSVETVFLSMKPSLIPYMMELIGNTETFFNKYFTMVPGSNGIVFYTQNAKQLLILLNSLTN